MSTYMLLQAHDSRSHEAGRHCEEFAESLARSGHAVNLFLVQDAVFEVRRLDPDDGLSRLMAAGVVVHADELSLRERGIGPTRIDKGVRPATLDVVVQAMAAGHKTIWP